MRRRERDRKAPKAFLHGLLACTAIAVGCGNGGASPGSGTPVAFDAGDLDGTVPDASDDAARDDDATPGDAGDAAPHDAAPDVAHRPDASSDAANTPDSPPGPQACGFSPCAAGAPCPDLTVDRYALLASVSIDTRTFQATDCAIAEGCVGQTGTRRLLHFDTGTINSGNADLHVGDPTTNACFAFSQCHQHYHFQGVARYTLYQADGTTVAAVGHKQGFCLEDVQPNAALNPPPADPATPYSCGDQGLHAGWEDIYPNNIDCQWIDITDVPPGQYVLSVHVDPEEYLPESDYTNNEAHVPVTVPP